jgi:GNAT superfamily N-acetyltransferase
MQSPGRLVCGDTDGVRIEIGQGTADDVERILGLLPDWFGIEEAVRGYVEDARRNRVSAAIVGGRVVGVLVAHRHYTESAEVHLMAVEPGLHRQGIGTALVADLERTVVADGARLLEVKTLGPSHPDKGYAQTRAFYQAYGFLPLEELPDHWPGNPCLIMVKPLAPAVPELE